jgi:RNA polymerase sigma factor (sigma-70 family)
VTNDFLPLGTPALSDEDLLAHYAEGDPKAFEAFVNRHQGRVFGYARRLLNRNELAAEAAQECFLKLHAKIHHYHVGEPALRWFFVVVHRTCLDVKRREQRLEPRATPMSQPSLDTSHDEGRVESALAALRELPQDSQSLVHARIFKDQSFEELSKESGRPSSALRKAYSRIVAKLRVDLGLRPTDRPKDTKHEQ